MSKFIDYYKMLQVHHEASQEVINAAYRCFSRIYHPDVNNNTAATEQMKMINEAYSIIGNPKKRETYHKEWLGNSNGRPQTRTQPAPPRTYVSVMREKDYAKKALEDFFDNLIKEEWEKSYQKLTAADKRNVPLNDYIEWKKAVTHLYKLGNYKIEYFCSYDNCEYAGTSYPKIMHFSITVTEMETITGKVNREQTQKYVAKDNGGWKVCLGYTDLKSSIRKFKYLAEALPRADRDEIIANALASIDPQTGIYSRKGFIEQAEKELRRCERYGNPLSLAAVELRSIKGSEKFFENEKDAIVSHVSEILSGDARRTDIVGRCGEQSFAVLLIETKMGEAINAMGRLLDTVGNDEEEFRYEVHWAVSELIDGNFEELLDETFENTKLREKSAAKSDEDIRLGKYRLSDILEFNRRGKNHF